MDGMRRVTLVVALLASSRLHVPTPLFGQTDDGAQRIAQTLIPQVERAVGLSFRRPPAIAVRTREQVRQFLTRKLAAEYPPAELEANARTYRAFRLIPDTLDLRQLLVDLYSEQVAGFFDPDSSRLFVVRGADPTMVRAVLAHELVHALQDQHTRLNAILKMRGQNDRQMAGQAVIEGQAMVAMISVMSGGQVPELSQIRGMIRQQQGAMPVFATAPKIIQEAMLFPYTSGGEFVQAFEQRRASVEEQPFNDRLPVSTEQILHFSRYTSGEKPVNVTIAASPGDTLVYDDNFGEFETRVALETWGATEGQAAAGASGWNGDRYAVLGTRTGTAVIWAVAFDSPADAQEFERTLRTNWTRANQGRADAGARRSQVELMEIGGVNVVRLVDAPTAWVGWRRLPVVTISPR